mmetsp:Transcript_10158/g.14250  ORF Transcript_10158/g.14250 Transcript_10158/m.14250 type:complete len:306 (-) Transcript_10158:252-1169(-)
MVSTCMDPSLYDHEGNTPTPKKKSFSSSSSNTKKLSRPERKKMERAIKKSRKTGIYQLHSTRISELNVQSSTLEDVMIAIKRAQNLHDDQDIGTIGRFLLEGVDDTFAYGYKGSVLARFAVAALRCGQYDIAQQALDERQTKFQDSMQPHESAAIVRGWNRANLSKKAFEVLDQELSLTSINDNIDEAAASEIVKHRALSLAAIASRHFYENQSLVALKACQMLIDLSSTVKQMGLTEEFLSIPWDRLEEGAKECSSPDAKESSCVSMIKTTQSHFPSHEHVATTWEDTLNEIMEKSTRTTAAEN